MASFWHTPYFLDKLVLLPALDFASPPSESDFLLLLLIDRPDALRASFGPLDKRSLRLNLWLLPSVEATDGALGRVAVGDWGSGGAGAVCSFLVTALAGICATLSPDTPEDRLGALLCLRLGA